MPLDDARPTLAFSHFFIPCVPVPKARPRFTSAGFAYTPKSTRDFEQLVATSARVELLHAQPYPKSQSVSVALVFVLPVPTSWSAKRRKAALLGDIRPTAKPDLDNLIKSVLDGMAGIAYVDDSQIADLIASKTYGTAPGVDVYLSRGPFSETEKQTLISARRTKDV